MGTCALTQDYVQDCQDFFAGVNTVYIIEYTAVTATTVTAGAVTALTKATGKFFRKYAIQAHTAEADDVLTVKPEFGTRSTKQSVKFPINGLTTTVRNEIELLAVNRLIFVIIDENGIGWMYGKDYGLRLQTATGKTGKALGDHIGWDFVFEGEERHLAYAVDPTVISALVTPG